MKGQKRFKGSKDVMLITLIIAEEVSKCVAFYAEANR
jgi:hypothetical protein